MSKLIPPQPLHHEATDTWLQKVRRNPWGDFPELDFLQEEYKTFVNSPSMQDKDSIDKHKLFLQKQGVIRLSPEKNIIVLKNQDQSIPYEELEDKLSAISWRKYVLDKSEKKRLESYDNMPQ